MVRALFLCRCDSRTSRGFGASPFLSSRLLRASITRIVIFLAAIKMQVLIGYALIVWGGCTLFSAFKSQEYWKANSWRFGVRYSTEATHPSSFQNLITLGYIDGGLKIGLGLLCVAVVRKVENSDPLLPKV
ncbi:MAG: hypothetical protein QM796_06610 [Chthoniobacteraceae bacterium]